MSSKCTCVDHYHKNDLRYEDLVSKAAVGIFEAEPSGEVTFVNPYWCDLTGMRRKNALGQGWINAVHPDDRKIVLNVWKEVIETKADQTAQFRFLRSDREVVWVQVSTIVRWCPCRQDITSILGTVTDITALKSLEVKEREARKRAETANRAKTNFLAHMSHELRTPLSSIIGYAEMILSENKNGNMANGEEFTEKIHNNGEHLLDLIDQLLDLARIESGKEKFFTKRFNLKSILMECIDTISPCCSKRSITLSHKIDDVGEVVADPSYVRRVLVNLLSNACKFTPMGERVGVRLGICSGNEVSSVVPEAGDISSETEGLKSEESIFVEVWDTGIGIKAGDQARVFEDFSRVESAYQRKYPGAGLGLALAKKMAVAMGSELFLKSIPDVGTSFFFVLRRKADETAPFLTKTNRITTPLSEIGNGSSILFVDDDLDFRVLIDTMLTKAGFDIVQAGSADEAIRLCSEMHSPSLLLLDIQLPDMNGVTLLKKLHSIPHLSSVPAVALTAHALPEDRKSFISAGFDEVVAKPVSLAKLPLILSSFLN